jgi:glycosyltransferase involved in cell wall biosynthesis
MRSSNCSAPPSASDVAPPAPPNRWADVPWRPSGAGLYDRAVEGGAPHLSTHAAEEQLPPNRASEPVPRCLWLTKGLGRGGVERLLVDMYPLVDPTRFSVDVAYILPWKNNYHQTLVELGADVRCLGGGRSGDPRWLPRLRRLLIDGRYDIVHSHAPLPGVAARTLPLSGDRPAIVHTEHNMWDRYRRPTRFLNSVTYGRNQQVIAVSDSVAATIRPGGEGRHVPVRTVLHGTVLGSVGTWQPEGDGRAERRAQLGLPADSFLIGNVANFTAKKDHGNLLRALAGPGAISRAHLALVGLGPLESELRRTVETLGIGNRVTFLGSRDDVFDLLPLFDLFCLSSEFEGFPIALVEAMATGLPCVSTAVGGVPEILVDRANGLLVPARDHDALRQAIETLIDDPDLARRCGAGANQSAQQLDLRVAVRSLEAVYDEALSRAGT